MEKQQLIEMMVLAKRHREAGQLAEAEAIQARIDAAMPTAKNPILNQRPPGLPGGSPSNNQELGHKETRTRSNALNEEDLESLLEKQGAEALAKYGDIMGVVDNHALFLKAQDEWGWYARSLTAAVQRKSVDKDGVIRGDAYGVGQVLRAIRYTLNYRGARDKGKFLGAVLNNGYSKKVS